MNNHRSQAVILSVSDFSESDKVVTFFSPDIGRVTGIAKGAKRSKKRFVNKLEEFSLLQVMYRPARRGGLLLLLEADLENAFLGLRNRYASYVAAMFAVELVLRLTREMDPDPQIFRLLLWSMQALDRQRDPLETAALFHLKILGASGYEPQLVQCGCCGGPIRSKHAYTLDPDSGSLFCSSCRDDIRGPASALSVQTIRCMQHAQRLDLTNLARLRLRRINAMEILANLQRYTRHLLQQEIISWNQLRQLPSLDILRQDR
jgi:DNA repair protein RecO (recombination protein O)